MKLFDWAIYPMGEEGRLTILHFLYAHINLKEMLIDFIFSCYVCLTVHQSSLIFINFLRLFNPDYN